MIDVAPEVPEFMRARRRDRVFALDEVERALGEHHEIDIRPLRAELDRHVGADVLEHRLQHCLTDGDERRRVRLEPDAVGPLHIHGHVRCHDDPGGVEDLGRRGFVPTVDAKR